MNLLHQHRCVSRKLVSSIRINYSSLYAARTRRDDWICNSVFDVPARFCRLRLAIMFYKRNVVTERESFRTNAGPAAQTRRQTVLPRSVLFGQSTRNAAELGDFEMSTTTACTYMFQRPRAAYSGCPIRFVFRISRVDTLKDNFTENVDQYSVNARKRYRTKHVQRRRCCEVVGSTNS